MQKFFVIGASIVVIGFLAALGFAHLTSDGSRQCALDQSDIGRFVEIPGGGFIKGADAEYPEEGPPTRAFVSPFLLQIHEVTNGQFARFVEATGYVTEAEKGGGTALFIETETPTDLSSWWRFDEQTNWKSSKASAANAREWALLPVNHVSLNDARAYAAWAGGRIPNEVEWEYAASLGLFDPSNPRSGIEGPDGEPRANIWTGIFPVLNTEKDGFADAAPVGCYQKSLVGVYDMIGNLWEWTESRFGRGSPKFTIKGGSYLCGANFCRRYRAAAREPMEQDFSAAHLGFRIVRDIAPGQPTSP